MFRKLILSMATVKEVNLISPVVKTNSIFSSGLPQDIDGDLTSFPGLHFSQCLPQSFRT